MAAQDPDHSMPAAATLQEQLAAADAEVARLNRELAQALEQQTATAEIMRVIAESPTDVQSALDAIVDGAMRLSGSTVASLALRESGQQRIMAMAGSNLGVGHSSQVGDVIALSGQRPGGRSILEGRIIHIPDGSDPALLDEYPEMRFSDAASRLHVPLLRDAEARRHHRGPRSRVSIQRARDRPRRGVRGPGRDRHRECQAVRGAGAAQR